MLTGPDDKNIADPACALLGAFTGVHCVAAPLIERLSPVLAGEGAHLALAIVAGIASVAVIFRGWFQHQDFRVFHWAFPGWLLLGMARFGISGEELLTIGSAALLIVAHQLNRSLGYWHSRP